MAKKTVSAKPPEQVEKIQIPPLNLATAKVTIVGISPLLVNKFDEKSRQEIEDKYQKKAKQNKIPKTPKEEFEASLYRIPGKKDAFGVPAAGIKKAAVSACRFIDGMKMTQAVGAFHIIDDAGDGLVEIKGSKPVMDERIVRVGNFGNKKPATRRRARFDDWKVTFTVKYRPDVLSAEQLLNLYENAGFSVGLCEFRPEKNGSLGMFQVQRSN